MAAQAEKVGRRIEELRKERGWSKAELARRLPGVSTGNDVGRWEKGQHLPRTDTLDAIAGVLETTVADLYAGRVADRKSSPVGLDPIASANGRLAGQLDRIEGRLNQIAEALDLPDLPADESTDVARETERELDVALGDRPGPDEEEKGEAQSAAEAD
jgi:transcriptional regulator with XRE-family HTH domain